ncbi:hypothetical protein MUU53_21910 [Rhizobium lemnae]|uniref:Uncharacterized protein n=1 Tax=Rhizobium lemnae TaxID=1214924 RepID=A0ABV8EFZ1_9HYPH|nr:hypothetical protein [Rhizobium lemnae]MCJ8510524.1 hypothetical protein [Rhizobium lemnae]
MSKAPPSIDWMSELTEAVRNGLSVGELSKKLGVQTSAVHKHEHRTGIRLKRIRKAVPHKGNASGIDWPKVLQEAKASEMSTTALAWSLGVTLAAVLSAEDRTGIYLKRRHPNRKRIGGFKEPIADS